MIHLVIDKCSGAVKMLPHKQKIRCPEEDFEAEAEQGLKSFLEKLVRKEV